ncbi:MAG: BatD family protein [Spirochaetota bacterium]|nr:BatD family protein [Spirochaetota bacterium]
MRFLGLILIFIPILTFSEVQITNHKIKLSKNTIIKNDIFTLEISLDGIATPFSPDQLSVIYPNKLSTKGIDMINTAVSHSINPTNENNKFHIKLTFYFKGTKSGNFEIPNLPVSFINSPPFFITPKQNIKIIKTNYPNLIYYLIGSSVLIILGLIYVWVKFKPPYKSANLLEVKTYHNFIKLKNKNTLNLQINIKKLLIRYLRKKFKKKNYLINEWELGKFNNFTENEFVQQKLQQFWLKCSNSNWDESTLKTQEEHFKSFLYLLQQLNEKDEINES